MQNLNQFEIVKQNELEQVQGGVGLLIVIGGSLLAAGGAGVAGLLVISYVWLIYLKEQVGYEKIRRKI